MRAFYGRTLRFQFVRELSPNWVEYRIGPNTLALAGRFRFVENPTLEAGTAAVQLAFRVPYEAVDVCAVELTAAGIPLPRRRPTSPGDTERSSSVTLTATFWRSTRISDWALTPG